MSRQLFAVALLLGGIVVAIVRGQDEGNDTPAADSVPQATASDEYDDVWSKSDEAADGEEGDGDEQYAEEPTSRYGIAQAGAEDGDGMRSVLKNPPRTLSGLSESEGAFGPRSVGGQSSRRSGATRRLESAESESAESESAGTDSAGTEEEPVLTARAPGGQRARSGRYQPAFQEQQALIGGSLKLRSTAPMLQVEAIGPDAITVGKPATYQVLVVNNGAESAGDVTVSIAIPGSVELGQTVASSGEASHDRGGGQLLWTLPAVAGGVQHQLELQLTPREDRPFTLALDWSMRSAQLAATVQVQKPDLAVQIQGPEEILYGEQKVYTIIISNPGTGPAENVSLDVSTGGGGQARPIGTIPAGGQQQIGLKLTAREAGSLEISASVTADGLQEKATKSVVVRRAELAVQITGPAYNFAGTGGSYQIRVTNSGNASATGVEMSLRLPAGVRYLDGLMPAKEAAGRLTWTLDELQVGGEESYTINVQYEAAGLMVCEVSATGPADLAAAAQCETQVEAIADVAMAVSDPTGPIAVGDDMVYEIRVTNRGSKAAENIDVVGQFAEGIEPVRVEGHAAELVTGQAIFKTIPKIEAGKTLTLKVVARADRSGNHRFRAVLKCSDPDTQLVAEEMTLFFGPEAKSATRKTGGKR